MEPLIIYGLVIIAILIIIVSYSKSHRHVVSQQERVLAHQRQRDQRVRRIRELQDQAIAKDILVDELKTYAELVTHGVPDQYFQNTLLVGVEPDHSKAIASYIYAIQLEELSNLDTILDLANVLYISETDKDVLEAQRLYTYVWRNGYPLQRAIANDRLDQIDHYLRGERVNAYRQALQNLQDQQFAAIEAAQRIQMTTQTVVLPLQPIRPLALQTHTHTHAQTALSDSQNVHDSTLLKTMKTVSDKIKSSPPPSSLQADIDNAIARADVSDLRKQQATRALRQIMESRSFVSSFEKNEDDLLGSVWNIVKDKPLQEEALVNELSEMVEHGTVVCSTGRATRIMDTLNVINPDKAQFKPKWAMNRELMDKCGVVFNNTINELDPPDKKIFEDGEPGGDYSKLVDAISKRVKSELSNEYVKAGLVSEEDLNRELDAWLPSLF